MDHQEQDIDNVVQIKKERKKVHREYGSWLRANGPTFVTTKEGKPDHNYVRDSFSNLPLRSANGKNVDIKKQGANGTVLATGVQDNPWQSESEGHQWKGRGY